jgi:hypothetical protein
MVNLLSDILKIRSFGSDDITNTNTFTDQKQVDNSYYSNAITSNTITKTDNRQVNLILNSSGSSLSSKKADNVTPSPLINNEPRTSKEFGNPSSTPSIVAGTGAGAGGGGSENLLLLFLLGAGAFIILYSLTKSERKEE